MSNKTRQQRVHLISAIKSFFLLSLVGLLHFISMQPISPESPIRGRMILPSISPPKASAEIVNPLRLSYSGLTDGEKLIQAIEMEDYKEAKRLLENSSSLVNHRKPEVSSLYMLFAFKIILILTFETDRTESFDARHQVRPKEISRIHAFFCRNRCECAR